MIPRAPKGSPAVQITANFFNVAFCAVW